MNKTHFLRGTAQVTRCGIKSNWWKLLRTKHKHRVTCRMCLRLLGTPGRKHLGEER
jgi:hypothetical protein